MKKYLIAAALALSAGLAHADDIMAGFYGNTVASTGGMIETHTYYKADHSFTMKARGAEFAGTWALDGANLCRTFAAPPPGLPNPLCTPIAAHRVGDTWTITTNGATRTVTLLAGIQ